MNSPSPETDFLVGWTTTETREQALRLAHLAVEQRLAACAQINGPLASVYSWKQSLHEDEEWRLTLKFPASTADDLAALLVAEHPYDVHQWITCRAEGIHPPYAEWIADQTGPEAPSSSNPDPS